VAAVVHGRYCNRDCLAVAEVADADGRVGAIRDRKSAGVGWLKLAWRRARCELGVPENGAGGGEAVDNGVDCV
jgi:hypothetical protein